MGGATANTAKEANQPVSKSIVIYIEPTTTADGSE